MHTIWNPYIRVAQRILTCCFFARNDSLNLARLSELHFLYACKGRIDIGGIVTTIDGFLGVEPNPEDRVSRLNSLIKLLLR